MNTINADSSCECRDLAPPKGLEVSAFIVFVSGQSFESLYDIIPWHIEVAGDSQNDSSFSRRYSVGAGRRWRASAAGADARRQIRLEPRCRQDLYARRHPVVLRGLRGWRACTPNPRQWRQYRGPGRAD